MIRGQIPAPTTLTHERRTVCRPSCCKTPFMCAKRRQCSCHTTEPTWKGQTDDR